MAARELEVEVDISEMCLRCTVDTKCDTDMFTFSRQFRFEGAEWKLNYLKMGPHDNYLCLFKCSGELLRPFRVSVHVESSEDGRTVNVLPQKTGFTTQFEEEGACRSIWSQRDEDILRAVPEFRINGIMKLVVFLKPEGEECPCATCKFIAADDNDPYLESFLKDLGDLLHQDASTDVEFRCADADGDVLATVRAHKLLVCAQSPVLAAMFHSDMVESRTGVATVRDIDAGVFDHFIKYLYSGKLDELTLDTAMSLYEAGDRFQVGRLRRHCAQWMVKNLTIERSCEVLILADAHCDEELVEAIVTFVANSETYFDGCEDLCSKHPSLAVKVVERLCKLDEGMSQEGEYCRSRRKRNV